MGVGKQIGVFSGLAGAAGAAAAACLLRPESALGAALVAGLAGAASGAALGFLLGATIDQSLDRVGRALALGEPETPDERPPRALGWLLTAASDYRAGLLAESASAAARLREADLRRSVTESELKQVEATLDSLRDAVLVTDRFDELTRANEAAARLLGFTVAEALHKPIGQIVKDERLAELIRAARESESLTDRKHVEHCLAPGAAPGADPERRFDLTLACLPEPSGPGVAGVVTILRDVTREREISQMKTDFVSQVSHELRTPLSSINAYVEMLVDGEAKDETARAEFYEVIKNEADRLGRLIDNMLNISRIEAGIIQIERAEVDFVQVVKSAVEVMQPQARLKDITLITKAGPLVYTAQADRDMMLQVVLNLVSNAVKYTPEGGRVTVSVENDDATRSVMVCVADTGLGIPPDALERVFEKFYRVDNYKRVAKGTGLGLNLVKHIVETVHAGQVGVSSTVGMGSKFWFTIPFEPAGARRAAA